MDTEKKVERLPIILTHKVLVAGNGFFAGITMKGRILAERGVVDEDGSDIWIYGVNPGGISGNGATLEDAHNAFQKRLNSVFFDLAGGATSFSAFKRDVADFINDTNAEYEKFWQEAVTLVRKGKVKEPGMPSEPAETEVSVEVQNVKVANPAYNEQSLTATAA